MSKRSAWVKVLYLAGFSIWGATAAVRAGVPLNGLEGEGGVAFNPLAYTAGSPIENSPFSKPQFGTWYVHLPYKERTHIDWTTAGVAETLFSRLELSYGYEVVALSGLDDIQQYNLGAKVLLLKENAGGSNAVPAVSAGVVSKRITTAPAGDVASKAPDYYAVATKLIKEAPRPILLSAGVLSTRGRTLGVLGFDKDRKTTYFGNLDVLPVGNAAVGIEYKKGAEFSTFKNADYWNAHLAWFVDSHLTLVAAYVNAGDKNSQTKVGLGGGTVLSVQYVF